MMKVAIQTFRTNLIFWRKNVWSLILFFSYIVKYIVTNKNNFLYKLFYASFALYNKKGENVFISEFYIYYFRRYKIKLMFTFLWISMLKTTMWVCIINPISYLFVIKGKKNNIWLSICFHTRVKQDEVLSYRVFSFTQLKYSLRNIEYLNGFYIY